MYPEFFKKFGEVEKFENLKRTDIKTRIKELCKDLEIEAIHEVEDELWQDFLSLVKDVRHFLVHPYPAPDVFHKRIKQLLSKEPIYPEIAGKIIAHFYIETNTPIPPWLGNNQLFKNASVDLLF